MKQPWETERLSTTMQPLGGILAFDRGGDRITHASDTMIDIIGQPMSELLDAPLSSVLSRALQHQLRNILSLRHFEEDCHFAGSVETARGQHDVSVALSADTGHVVLEYEPSSSVQHSWEDFSIELSHLSAELRAAEGQERLMSSYVTLLRYTAGYDSALVYKFSGEGGAVIAESRNSAQLLQSGADNPHLEALMTEYRGLRRQVQHYSVEPGGAQSPIRAVDGVSAKLDLSCCPMRGVTTSAAGAMKALGARASLTTPLRNGSDLWGAACLFSSRPRMPSRYLRHLCDALAPVFSDRLEVLELSAAKHPAPVLQKAARPDLSEKSAIVVESNRLIASDLKLMLLDLGFGAVDKFVDDGRALAFLKTHRVDLGVLNMPLQDDAPSYAVARRLMDQGSPFLFASGLEIEADLPEWLGARPVIPKPASRRDLMARVDELVTDGAYDEMDRCCE